MADLSTLEELDGYSGLRNALRTIARDKDEWAGIPLPMDGMPLVVEPTYPRAADLMALGRPEPTEAVAAVDAKIRNSFWSWNRRSEIMIWEEDGKIQWGMVPGVHHLRYDLATLGASEAWGIEQEANAIQTLATLLRHRHFKQYMLTGSFLESSPRSGVTYLFRRLRPTVAMSMRGERTRVLCTLCLHPIAYYTGSWAGAMCPTDDVIAHLMLMRGDEPMFWRRANQHPSWTPESGL